MYCCTDKHQIGHEDFPLWCRTSVDVCTCLAFMMACLLDWVTRVHSCSALRAKVRCVICLANGRDRLIWTFVMSGCCPDISTCWEQTCDRDTHRIIQHTFKWDYSHLSQFCGGKKAFWTHLRVRHLMAVEDVHLSQTCLTCLLPAGHGTCPAVRLSHDVY